jgi:sodium transport system permease protein
MKLAEVMLVAGKELRETLRDRRTLAVMVLFPLVVYPLVSLATVQVLAARIGRGEKLPARVAISGPQPIAEQLRARLAARSHDGNPDFSLSLPPAPVTAADVRAGHVDAAIAVEKASAGATSAATARVLFDETQERSRTARARIEEALAAGLEPGCTASYAVTIEGVAPRTAMGGYLLSRILPLVIVVMVMLGAFHPAIDITAGERERSTLETTLSAPIARASLMTGKVVAVATLATLSGVLNLASMSITVLEGAKLAAPGAAPSLPWANAGAAALLVIPPAAFLFASVMVAIGALARSFKEAQTLLTPVYFMCMAPALLSALGDFELRGVAPFIPGVGVTLLARDVIAGHASVGAIVAVFASSVGYGAAALALACRLYDSERLLGADDAGLGLRAWLRHLLFGRRATTRDDARDPNAPNTPSDPNAPNTPNDPNAPNTPNMVEAPPTAGHALALFGVAVLLLFAFLPVQKWRLVPGLALFEWVGLLGLTAVYARGSGRRFTSVLRLRKPSLAAVAGAILIGASAWLVVGLLVQWVLPPPKEVEEHIRRIIPSGEGKGGFTFAILLVAFTPAICEEALFRGPILRGLRTRLSALGAAVATGLLFGLYHGDVWRFIPVAVLGFAFSTIALATDSIVPAMIAHFTNNACLIALARAGLDETGTELTARQRLTLVALGGVVLTLGAALIARAHRTRRVRDREATEGSTGQM